MEQADEDVVFSEAQRIWDGCQRLKHFPESGRPGRVPMTRELVNSPYVIPSRIQDDAVDILNIFSLFAAILLRILMELRP